MSFRIKICGVRSMADVDACVSAGADCVGLNFYSKSVRYVDASFASEVAKRYPDLGRVGVFVDESYDDAVAIAKDASLTGVQLHGDHSISQLPASLNSNLDLIRAIRLPTTAIEPSTIDDLARPWHQRGARILLDADAGAEFGGSGQRLDWDGIGLWAKSTDMIDWILAGGLTPENVASAIDRSAANSVDVASGTEGQRGVKDHDRIARFTEVAKSRLQR